MAANKTYKNPGCHDPYVLVRGERENQISKLHDIPAIQCFWENGRGRRDGECVLQCVGWGGVQF